ncbi:MAG: BufA2 family periplasmic bufferin-type metallophore [Stenotrophobium sp.]
MKNPTRLSGIALAAAAAGLFSVVAASSVYAADQAGAEKASVTCQNSSACKGHGACKTASNSCKGQNACKGHGMTMQPSKADCAAAQKANKA